MVLPEKPCLTEDSLSFCIYCSNTLSYGSTGKSDLLNHTKTSPKHHQNIFLIKPSTLQQSWIEPTNKVLICAPLNKPCSLPYGVAEKF